MRERARRPARRRGRGVREAQRTAESRAGSRAASAPATCSPRRIGRERARTLAAAHRRSRTPSPRCRAARTAATCARGWTSHGAQRAVAETTLWHIRVLAGWAPPGAQEAIRALAAWFELANIEDRLAFLAGGRGAAPVRPRRARDGVAARSPRRGRVADVRAALAASPWGDPGAAEPAGIGARPAPRVGAPGAAVGARGGRLGGRRGRAAGRARAVPGRAVGRRPAARRPPGIGSRVGRGREPAARCARRCRRRPHGRCATSRSPPTSGAPRWRGGGASSRTPRVLAHAPLMGEPMVDRQRRAAGSRRVAHGGARWSPRRAADAGDAVEVFDDDCLTTASRRR